MLAALEILPHALKYFEGRVSFATRPLTGEHGVNAPDLVRSGEGASRGRDEEPVIEER